jgi:biopolymer transport protein ExbD
MVWNTMHFMRRCKIGSLASWLRVLVLMVILASAGAIGCDPTSEPAGDRAIQVTVLPEGSLLVEGRKMTVRELPDRLKSMRIPSKTPIKVEVEENTPMATISEITRSLASAGYGKIVFTRPKRADSFAKKPH